MDENHLDRLGRCADRLDDLATAGMLPIPAEVRLRALDAALPEIRDEIKAALSAMGFDPWA
ncbi:hypothetical protein [Xanthomonas sacchari]|uniref:hypothetical protein n=1 Tax=Xanthomonas sacchari TaxID=56458 RepID=UPI0022591193|nr:hypothetical protein [Xanthomonas sacchari]MCW0370281.1 hypothetical protein [Xanthomonas sacchari]